MTETRESLRFAIPNRLPSDYDHNQMTLLIGDFLIHLGPRPDLIAAAGLGVAGLSAALGLTRKWVMHRRHEQWWTSRLTVPPRLNWESASRPRGGADRRRAPRRFGNPVTVSLFDRHDQKLGEARVTDRSIGGVCLATSTRLSVGSWLGVAPFGLQDASTRLSLEIRNALVVAGEWRLGCAFLRCPSWSTLMHLR